MRLRYVRATMAIAVCGLLTAFGCGGGGGVTPPPAPAFDGQRAMADLRTQVDFGPRAPGSPARAACLTWLQGVLKPLADDFEDQAYTFHPRNGDPSIAGNNLLAGFAAKPGATAGPLLISAHWDCRPVADQDPILANRTKPVPGANDAASGVAVLLELARVLQDNPPPRPVFLALWDLEDSGQLPQTAGTPYLGFCQGSRYFSQNMGRWRPTDAINLDMIGDANLTIRREGYSEAVNPSLNDAIFGAAAKLGHKQFVDELGTAIIDDHKPLIDAGVPAVDLIDFDYPGPNSNRYWHTLQDTPDKCSAASLSAVGETLLAVLFK